jgi:hypothetical protein
MFLWRVPGRAKGGKKACKKTQKKALTTSLSARIFTAKVIGQETGAISPGATSLKSEAGQGKWPFVVLHGQDAGDIWLWPM